MGYWFPIAVGALAILAVSIFLGGWFLLLLFFPLVTVLFALLVRGGSSPGTSRRARRHRPELLGPGGPDDPDTR